MTTKKTGGVPVMCHDYARGNTFHADGIDEFARRVAKSLAKRAGYSTSHHRLDSWVLDENGKRCCWHYSIEYLTEIRGDRARRAEGALFRIEWAASFTIHAVGGVR